MKKIALIGLLVLVSCNRQMSDVGYHDCNDAIHEYSLNVKSGKNKGIHDNLTIKASNTNLYIFPNGKFSVSYKLKDFKQETPNIDFQFNGDLMTGVDTKEETIVDPTTNKEWTRQRVTEIIVNNKTGELKKVLTEKHLDTTGNLTSIETYNLKAVCSMVSNS